MRTVIGGKPLMPVTVTASYAGQHDLLSTCAHRRMSSISFPNVLRLMAQALIVR